MIQNELQYILAHKIIAKIVSSKHFENIRERNFKFSEFFSEGLMVIHRNKYKIDRAQASILLVSVC